MKRVYFTKKRKREFDLTYKEIKSLKSAIFKLKIEAQTFLDYRNSSEAKSRFETIAKFKARLKSLAKAGWDTSSLLFLFYFIA